MASLLSSARLFPAGLGFAADLLQEAKYPWEVLPLIGKYIEEFGKKLDPDLYDESPGNVWIAKSAVVAPSASIGKNIIIGPGCEIRQAAFLRGNVLIGPDCVVGNSSEIKNSILIAHVQTPHFNYIGDSILGNGAHLGAGAITSNVKSDKTDIEIRFFDQKLKTMLRKFGAIIGDQVEIGCNSVLNPGCIIGIESRIYPLTSVRGYVPERSIVKGNGVIEKIK